MDIVAVLVLIVLGAVASALLATFAAVSVRERERRATIVSSIAVLPALAVMVLPWLAPDAVVQGVAAAAVAAVAIALVLWFLPIGRVLLNGRPTTLGLETVRLEGAIETVGEME